MTIQKLEWDEDPGVYEVVSVRKTNYRSGKRFMVDIRFYWGVTPVNGKFQGYTEVATLLFDSASESLADLKVKGQAALADLKVADRSEANLIFALQRLSL